ncbi:hypothetical protein V1387_12985 [Allomuricauda taeanensis]|uniref:hypothetical protein n=1 Tax=Flagellimonas taeanensis TaxID=1005926 RepID=UPI002E7BD517|nr:hypothetical protein [Allomuricauda taeanensis]MEE1963603.1 hypothetical protein [Allomuricauda taeanensis]
MKIIRTIACLVFLTLLSGCKEDAKNQTSTTDVLSNAQKSDSKTTNDVLDKQQFQAFFPQQLGGYELKDVSVLASNAIATGTYIKGNDYNHSLVLTLQDGNRKGSGIIKNFEMSYEQDLKPAPGSEYIKKERDGYKTIALVQPQVGRNLIELTYKNRFRISLEGVEDVDTLWRYLDKENFAILD